MLLEGLILPASNTILPMTFPLPNHVSVAPVGGAVAVAPVGGAVVGICIMASWPLKILNLNFKLPTVNGRKKLLPFYCYCADRITSKMAGGLEIEYIIKRHEIITYWIKRGVLNEDPDDISMFETWKLIQSEYDRFYGNKKGNIPVGKGSLYLSGGTDQKPTVIFIHFIRKTRDST